MLLYPQRKGKFPYNSPENMLADAIHFGRIFPYLFDAPQDPARSYQAARTLDFFLSDKNLKLVYSG